MAEMDRSEVLDLYRKLQTMWSARNGEYNVARDRFEGIHWDPATNPEPRNRYSLTLNYLKPFVEKSVQLLVGRMPAMQVMPSATDDVARRHAESLEGILYGTWEANDFATTLLKTAWDSFVLRRGLVYVYWDPRSEMVKLQNCVPDNFYPDYDGDEIWRAVYVTRRITERLKMQYPDHVDEIKSDSDMDFTITSIDEHQRANRAEQTTIYDVFYSDGSHTRVMGEWVMNHNLDYPYKSIPFIEFPCFSRGGMAEPMNLIDQLVELNQYLDQLVSQKADIIQRYANPTIIDYASGQSAEEIRQSVSAQGAVIPVRKDGDIKLLNWQGTVPAIDEQIELIKDTMFDLAGKPRSAFGQTATNQSGIVTNLALTPTLQSNESHETVWGKRLSQMNEWILMLWEKFESGSEIKFKGRYQTETGSSKIYETSMTGKDIAGWYKNRIKWPSAIRTDDPVYVQNNLQQLQAQPFPAISLYTYLENMGVEDVEAEIDRIGLQLEDARFHPDRLTAAANATQALQGQSFGGDIPAEDPSTLPPGQAASEFDSLEAAGNPEQNNL